MQIPQPYLLFLGDVTDPLAAKTARGIQKWRPELCLGQMRLSDETVSLGLPDLSLIQAKAAGVKTVVIGIANAGGFIPNHWLAPILEALQLGINVASGMHQRLSDFQAITLAANSNQCQLYDARHYNGELEVGTGIKRQGKRLLTVGTDCSVGKMYTSLALEQALNQQGIKAKFCATGQTGVLISGSGIAIDAVPADFISGAVEKISPAQSSHEWDIIEGQGSLFHPSYAGVSLGLMHGAQPDALVLCHEIGRQHIRHLPHMPMPDIKDVLSANLYAAKLTNPEPKWIGISLNTSALDKRKAEILCRQWEKKYGLPVTDPVRFGVANIADNISNISQ